MTPTPRQREVMCVQGREGWWHARTARGDSWFVPIRCGGPGVGINLPGHAERRVPTCPECLGVEPDQEESRNA